MKKYLLRGSYSPDGGSQAHGRRAGRYKTDNFFGNSFLYLHYFLMVEGDLTSFNSGLGFSKTDTIYWQQGMACVARAESENENNTMIIYY